MFYLIRLVIDKKLTSIYLGTEIRNFIRSTVYYATGVNSMNDHHDRYDGKS